MHDRRIRRASPSTPLPSNLRIGHRIGYPFPPAALVLFVNVELDYDHLAIAGKFPATHDPADLRDQRG
jgi:hypothetical protein